MDDYFNNDDYDFEDYNNFENSTVDPRYNDEDFDDDFDDDEDED